jgi:hypothetical protein
MSRFLAGPMDKTLETEVRGSGSDGEDTLKVDRLGKVKFYGTDLSESLMMVAARNDV